MQLLYLMAPLTNDIKRVDRLQPKKEMATRFLSNCNVDDSFRYCFLYILLTDRDKKLAPRPPPLSFQQLMAIAADTKGALSATSPPPKPQEEEEESDSSLKDKSHHPMTQEEKDLAQRRNSKQYQVHSLSQ